jgi:hypothetical protein
VSGWNWNNPTFDLTFASTIAAIAIPCVLTFWGSKSNKRMARLEERQAQSLALLEAAQTAQWHDQMLRDLPSITDRARLQMLSADIFAASGLKGEALRFAFRSNPHVPLPGAEGTWVDRGRLDADAINGYVVGLPSRFAHREGFQPFPGLQDFLEHCTSRKPEGISPHISDLASLMTGPAGIVQHPGHRFFHEVASRFPALAPALIYEARYIDHQQHGGLKLNVLLGVLLAFKESDGQPGSRFSDSELREELAQALTELLMYGTLKSLDSWSQDGATDVMTAAAAWLILAVGHLATVDSWLTMRMMENLPVSLQSLPAEAKRSGWGVDAGDVKTGLALMRKGSPQNWANHGSDLEQAVSAVQP